jgi:hypothetical protein
MQNIRFRRVFRLSLMCLCYLITSVCENVSAASEMPELKAQRWVNSVPLTPTGLRGKIVLVDVWEYTCINWIRTSPYVKAWNRDYGKLGLVVVGVHAPEFEFGKQAEHIDRGIRDHRLDYPIAIDNDFAIWKGLNNSAWPAKYLFDAQGRLVKRWIGEGSYDEIEATIRNLLLAANPGISLPKVTPEVSAFQKKGMPSYGGLTDETYLGAGRGESRTVKVTGDWKVEREYIELKKGAGKIEVKFIAGEVNLVVQPRAMGTAAFEVLLDGKPVGRPRGEDVGPEGVARFSRSGMIRLIAQAPRERHVMTLITNDPGLRAYVLTFGP